MKKYVLKKWVKVVLFILLFISLFIITPKDKKNIEYCINQGNSRISCEKGYFGY